MFVGGPEGIKPASDPFESLNEPGAAPFSGLGRSIWGILGILGTPYLSMGEFWGHLTYLWPLVQAF
jgi:hypothetical protein